LAAAVVPIPPLRARLEDLALLVPILLHDLGRPDLQLSEATYAHLREHSWPGNVRELKNTLAAALAFVEGGALEPRHLRFMGMKVDATRLEDMSLGGKSLEELERMAIEQTLRAGCSKAQAAQALGISLSTLYEKLKKFNL
jgi:transcriptional regulator with PAS, ATPase and Fis domain